MMKNYPVSTIDRIIEPMFKRVDIVIKAKVRLKLPLQQNS